MTKGKSGGASMILKRIMEVYQDYIIFNYGPLRPHKHLNSQDIPIVSQAGMKPEPKCVLPGHIKEKVGNETPQMRW